MGSNYVLTATNTAGLRKYWTGRAGDAWLNAFADEAYTCLREEAVRKAEQFNRFTSVHGWTFTPELEG